MNTSEAKAITDEYQFKADAMKQSVLNTSDTTGIRGVRYYVSESGSDSADGLTPETAFRSIDRLKQLQLQNGDAVLFHRGDLFRGSSLEIPDGVTVSAWGQGAKPTVCGSRKNYADPSLWKQTEHAGIWRCTEPQENAGLITFDHDPREIGKYDVLCGWLVCPAVDMPWDPKNPDLRTYVFPDPPPLQLKNDLEFWTDNQTKTLYLRSAENPGERFHEIEIAPGEHAFVVWHKHDVTIDNLHVTLVGRHGISGWDVRDLEVRNCVLDYIGGSVLWEQCRLCPDRRNVRFGNAVEAYAGCIGFRVYNNWIYQIYDTGITHQSNDTCEEIVMRDVEYRDNLIEYCFWSIEYYNSRNKYGITQNIYVHDNFCRFGGSGWGCKLRKYAIPMYSLSTDADETADYVTENNIFQISTGHILLIYGKKPDMSGFIFRHNTYIQYEDDLFSRIRNTLTPFSDGKRVMQELFHEDDASWIAIPRG